MNADLIAAGLVPLKPEIAAVSASRIFLQLIDQLVAQREDLAFETTLSGKTYVERIKHMKELGYRVDIIFLKLSSPNISLERITRRVAQGGHDVPKADVLRRFKRGWANLEAVYKPLADGWAVYDNSNDTPLLIEERS